MGEQLIKPTPYIEQSGDQTTSETAHATTEIEIPHLFGDCSAIIMEAVCLKKDSQSHSGTGWSSENGYLKIKSEQKRGRWRASEKNN